MTCLRDPINRKVPRGSNLLRYKVELGYAPPKASIVLKRTRLVNFL